MAKTDIRVNCGCGMQFTSVLEAEKHAEVTGHTLTGLITVKKGIQ